MTTASAYGGVHPGFILEDLFGRCGATAAKGALEELDAVLVPGTFQNLALKLLPAARAQA